MARRILPVVVVGAVLFFSAAVAASADTVGDVQTFHTNTSFDAEGASTITATARIVSQDAYFYVDNRAWNSMSPNQRIQFMADTNQLATKFDTEIYPWSTAFWGSEARPGVDGDLHVTILLEELKSGFGGYFETINNYDPKRASDSNGREMVYISSDSITTGSAKNFLAHEFQHLISFNQKELLRDTHDDIWLNEARSEYNITVVGYSEPFDGSALQRRMQSFLKLPSDSLVDWKNTLTDYAIASIFTHYVADRLGSDIIGSTVRSYRNGIDALQEWLSAHNSTETFADIFTDWMVASYLNDSRVDSRYGYVRPGLASIHVVPEREVVLGASPYTFGHTFTDWQPAWFRFDAPSDSASPAVSVRLSAASGPWLGGAAIAAYADGHRTVRQFSSFSGTAAASIPMQENGSALRSVVLAVSEGTPAALDGDSASSREVTIEAAVGEMTAPVSVSTGAVGLKDGDLVRRGSEKEVYVIWGKYRRYLVPGILELYGFQDRPVISIPDDVFYGYISSNYIRQVDTEPVYAVWPDGTKHWFAITAAQWDASGRDWNSIFIVNDREAAFYPTGAEITR
jgi:hypothetical protein